MKRNVGKTDSIIRIVIALVIFALGFYYRSWWGLLGVLPLLTATISWCPVYVPFGISTRKR